MEDPGASSSQKIRTPELNMERTTGNQDIWGERFPAHLPFGEMSPRQHAGPCIHQRRTTPAVINIRPAHVHTHSRRSPLNIYGGGFHSSFCIVSFFFFIFSDQTLSQVAVWMKTQHTHCYIIHVTQIHTSGVKKKGN